MPRARSRKDLQEATAPPASKASDGFPQVAELVVPLPPPQPANALPDTPPEALVLPLPKSVVKQPKLPKRKAPKIEAYLSSPVEPTPAKERQHCLALMMRTTGHSLDWGCRLCVTNCVYAAPCGCGGWDCIDRKGGEPLVVFQETVHVGGKRRGLFRKSKARAPGADRVEPILLKILKPWTWFRR
jgi:hypothetical protein